MDASSSDKHVLDWDERDVQNWLASKGYPQYEGSIREHKICGDILCDLDSDGLKGLGVSTIGQRLAILKAIYQLKVANRIPIGPDQYVPPSEAEASERLESMSVEKLHTLVKEQESRIQKLEEENRGLSDSMRTVLDELSQIRSQLGRPDENNPLKRQPSFRWAQYKPAKSPTKADIESPHPSPQQLEHDLTTHSRVPPQIQTTPAEKSRQGSSSAIDSPDAGQTTPRAQRQESSDNLKSLKVSLDDPTWKVLPAALRKYRINNDIWQNYAMFICYGSPGNRIERCLSYDEKPLLLFQKLKDLKKSPVFMLKHIKDIRSPIAVAQQKHAARKAASVITTETAATHGHHKAPSTSRTNHRPPRLDVQDLSTPAPALSGVTPQPGWPEPGMVSPSVGDRDEAGISWASTSTVVQGSSGASTTNGHDRLRPNGGSGEHSNSHARESPPSSNDQVSYAVAIYPYMAEQDDEFDVVVGDTFVILSRVRGWWSVQRDPTGSGIVDSSETAKSGWVPAGCLLETNVPVASAIAEATAKSGTSTSKTPILPLSIISTSFPGVALMDYKGKGEEELDLVKDDALRVFKKYNHWSYAVKEDGGERGWVPSWFIGKVNTSSEKPPPTPNTSLPLTSDDPTHAQVSPMSSAFPSVQNSRATPVL
ncbi:hypothetical protein AX16_001420 [Volvariella volvacea WC 439]|nr:hypothetical protein AX16_001420 [Volvariella volvacea WC 439]